MSEGFDRRVGLRNPSTIGCVQTSLFARLQKVMSGKHAGEFAWHVIRAGNPSTPKHHVSLSRLKALPAEDVDVLIDAVSKSLSSDRCTEEWKTVLLPSQKALMSIRGISKAVESVNSNGEIECDMAPESAQVIRAKSIAAATDARSELDAVRGYPSDRALALSDVRESQLRSIGLSSNDALRVMYKEGYAVGWVSGDV